LELGAQEEILKAIDSNKLDAEAIQRIGNKYKVTAVFYGDILYSDIN